MFKLRLLFGIDLGRMGLASGISNNTRNYEPCPGGWRRQRPLHPHRSPRLSRRFTRSLRTVLLRPPLEQRRAKARASQLDTEAALNNSAADSIAHIERPRTPGSRPESRLPCNRRLRPEPFFNPRSFSKIKRCMATASERQWPFRSVLRIWVELPQVKRRLLTGSIGHVLGSRVR